MDNYLKKYFLLFLLPILFGCDLEIKTKNDNNSCFYIEGVDSYPKNTFMINKCTGESWMLVRTTGDDYDKYEWFLIPRLDTQNILSPLFPKTKKSK